MVSAGFIVPIVGSNRRVSTSSEARDAQSGLPYENSEVRIVLVTFWSWRDALFHSEKLVLVPI